MASLMHGHEHGQTPGDGEGQGGLACCRPWCHRVRHNWATEQQQYWVLIIRYPKLKFSVFTEYQKKQEIKITYQFFAFEITSDKLLCF